MHHNFLLVRRGPEICATETIFYADPEENCLGSQQGPLSLSAFFNFTVEYLGAIETEHSFDR